jgi:chemotaxis protein histidine kinase CheA
MKNEEPQEQKRESFQKHQAGLAQIDAQIGQMEAVFQRTSAEDLRLTQEEFELMRRSLDTVRQSLSGLRQSDDDGWDQAQARLEQAWTDFQEHSRKLTGASAG